MNAECVECALEPTLVVIGVNYRSAPVEVRERFWISESRRYEALVRLGRSEAIEEIAVLATSNRTEFILWTRDASVAANSVLNFLTAEYALRLCEWKHFYRLIGEAALVHLFKVASSLDSIILGEPEINGQMKEAWLLAQKVGTTGRYLDSVFQKAFMVSERVRGETAVGECAVSVPYAAVELARQLFGSLEGRKIVLLGAGRMGELSAEYLRKNGVKDICVVNRTVEKAQEIAERLGGKAAAYEERWQAFIQSDIIISASMCPHIIFTREEGEYIRQERQGRPLLMVDITLPRDVDPGVRSIHGIFLYDIDDLEQVIKRTSGVHASAAEQATEIVLTEAKFFARKLATDFVVPTVVALRERLDDLCRQELEAFRHDVGPFTDEQEEVLKGLAQRIGSRIAGSLARELKELPEKMDQDELTLALQKLFHLPRPSSAVAGTN
jgi:glutamyl-tRNA reductase